MNTININTMKKTLILFALAMMLMPLTAMAQKNVFDKYSDNDDVTYNVITNYPEILKISVGENKDNLQGVSKQWDAFFDSVKPIKRI